MVKRGKQFIYGSEVEALSHLDERGIAERDTISYKMVDLTGCNFGNLTVIRLVGITKTGSSSWLCKCERCDDGFYIITTQKSLSCGDVKSCGCLAIETKKESITHNMSNTSEYRAWASMKSRCYTESTTSYPNYGALGVNVCNEWLESFEAFIEDMGRKPADNFVLDRIDPEGSYCKENCRWVDVLISSHNKGLFDTNTSGYKGVSKAVNKWRASITKDGTHYRKGGFSTPEDAAEWYDKKATELYGEYACTNKSLGLL